MRITWAFAALTLTVIALGLQRIALLMALLLASAACSTPYQPDGWTGGYKDERLGPNTWRVSFQGNPNRDATFVMNAAMYRAAEIAKREGHGYFQVTLASTVVTHRAYVNFTNLVSHKAELTMSGVPTFAAGCPQGRALGCQVYATDDALARYGRSIGVSPKR